MKGAPLGPVLREAIPGDSRSHLLRAFTGDADGPGIARAFLSNAYRPIDHLDGLMAALDGVREAGVETRVHSADLTDRRMVVRIVCPEVQALAPTLLAGYRSPYSGASGSDNPTVFAGLKFTNSETGHGAWQVVPELRVQVCDNGMTLTKHALREVHLGSRLDAGVIRWSDDTVQAAVALVRKQTRDAVATFLDVDYMTRVITEVEGRAAEDLSGDRIEDNVRALTKPLGYTRAQQDGILASFIQGGQITRGGVYNAVTAYAQTLDADTRFDVEAKAVRILAPALA